jgi:hypothetical protein
MARTPRTAAGAAEQIPGGIEVGVAAQHVLTLAVVAEAARLEDTGHTDALQRARQLGAAVHGGETRGGYP